MKRTLVVRMDVDTDEHVEALRVIEAILDGYAYARHDYALDVLYPAEGFLEAEWED